MTRQHDGGPAYPQGIAVTTQGDVYESETPGMSLRDYFAVQALIGNLIVTDEQLRARVESMKRGGYTSPSKWIAEMAYQHADAMLAARAVASEAQRELDEVTAERDHFRRVSIQQGAEYDDIARRVDSPDEAIDAWEELTQLRKAKREREVEP